MIYRLSKYNTSTPVPINGKQKYYSDRLLEGKVKLIKTDIVQFSEQETGLDYELKKSEIKVIVLGSGKSITFADEAPAPDNQQPVQVQQPVIVEQDSGPSTGLIILASVGAMLGLLLIVGAIAQ